MAHDKQHPLAGTIVKVKLNGRYPHVNSIKIEDWWDRLDPRGVQSPVIAAQMYRMLGGKQDEEVVYGKHENLGYLVHVSELVV